MAFRFSLHVVLRVRQSLEHQQELLLQAANHRTTALRREIDDLERSMEEIAAQRAGQLKSGLSAAELQFAVLCRSALWERRQQLEQSLNKAREERDACAQVFRKVRRDREVVETLRDRQFQLYRQLEARQNQRRLDDLFLLRRSYLQRG